MVPYRRSVEQPLLPYEKRLIAALGCNEQEYRQFAQEVERRYKECPEDYAHIPNIQNGVDPVSVLVNIAISAIFTAASMLLAPKPSKPKESELQRRQLGGQQGKSVFAPSFGFDSVQSLAEYGQTVPIVFTQRHGSDENGTGGLLIAPQMVWSRMKSWGNYQIAELVAIAGQGSMNRPELAGIFLGNNALDGIYEEYFDFYWNGGFEVLGFGSRLRGYNLRYGNLAIDGNRDNEGIAGADQAFYAPVIGSANQPAFCGAFSPSSQTRFGVYSGVPNGTPLHANWRVISIPSEFNEVQREQRKNQQKKYVDSYLMDTHEFGGGSEDAAFDPDATNAGMPGTGTNYCRRIGIISHSRGNTTTTISNDISHLRRELLDNGQQSWHNLKLEVDCQKDDEIKVLIGKGLQTERPFPCEKADPISLTDIKTSIQSESTRYDALFLIGSTWMIGKTTWQVIGRSNPEPYDSANSSHVSNGVTITLKCIETWSQENKRIGLVAEKAITKNNFLPFTQEEDDIHESWYPLTKYELGTFQNTRSCDVTEVGIKSQVWTKFEGLTNFNTIPAPGILVQENKNNIELSEGKMTTFSHRMSMFVLDVRPSNYDASASLNQGWVNMGPYAFAVVGSSPVDQYSFIRITHPERKQFEYRFRPIPSAVLVNQGDGAFNMFVLDGGRFGSNDWRSTTKYGNFHITGRGYFAQPRDYFTHSEMAAVPELITDEDGAINIRYNTVDSGSSSLSLEKISITNNEVGSAYPVVGMACTPRTESNMYAVAAGSDPYFNNLPNGSTTSIPWHYTREVGKEVYMRLHLISYEQNYANTPRNKWWRVDRVELESFNGNRFPGETFDKYNRNSNGVQFAFKYKFSQPTSVVSKTRTKTATRLWQKFSGVAEVSHYADLISRSCDSSPEHEIIYVNESLDEEDSVHYEGCAMAGLKFKSSDNFNQIDQLRIYLKFGVQVERLIEGDVASSNLLTDLFYYLVTNKDTGAGNILNADLVDKALLTTTSRYLVANKLYWDDVIAEPINLRSWLSQQAPSVLCFVSIKNGKTSIEPALPYDSNYEIDAVNPVIISAMFTEGNIIEDSLEVTWLELEERKMFQAAIIYQQSRVNQFPEQKTLVAYYGTDNSDLAIEEFSISHITSDEHAAKVARYFLALRKHLTHTITFKTLPWGLNLEAGKFIRVASEMSPYRPDNNGIIQDDGTIVAINVLTDGAYNVYYWERQTTAVSEGVLHVRNGKATELFNSVFSLKESASSISQVYQIEALDMDQDGIVTIKASNYAVNADGVSRLAIDVLDTAGAITIEGDNDE